MKKGHFVLAVTQGDLARVYGESRELRELVRRLERSSGIEESLGLHQFDDANWLRWASPTLAPELGEMAAAPATVQLAAC
jgi:hypothetical protein